MTLNTANPQPHTEQLHDSSFDFTNVLILSSPASEETKCQSRMDLLENDLYLSASGAVNLDINTDFCPLLPEAKFPFLAIEKEKKVSDVPSLA